MEREEPLGTVECQEEARGLPRVNTEVWRPPLLLRGQTILQCRRHSQPGRFLRSWLLSIISSLRFSALPLARPLHPFETMRCRSAPLSTLELASLA